ncbi:hypothetical protein ACFV9C_41950 [Kribbella sp. NPDC059898]|uniref:hypothetical protein n=1 Tax=Kribbella sp. NPDC059898 TaxID=3346995 RepID=UPI00365E75D7
MTQEQLATGTVTDGPSRSTGGAIEIHAAIHLKDYEVVWSTAAHTHEDLIAAIKKYAVEEYCAEPADYPEIADEQQAAEQHGDVLDRIGVLVTETFSLPATADAPEDCPSSPYTPGLPECVPIGDRDHDAHRSGATG